MGDCRLIDSVNFKDILSQESDIGKVIHTQINIELLITDFLYSVLDSPEFLKPIRLDYSSSVNLSLALGFNEDLKGPLLAIGKLRNDFAHKLDQVIDKNKINFFYKSFSSRHQNEFIEIAKDLELGWYIKGTQWRDVEPTEKFTLLCISLYYWCRFAVMDGKHKNKLTKISLKKSKEIIEASS